MKHTRELLEVSRQIPTRIQVRGAETEPDTRHTYRRQNVAHMGSNDDQAAIDAARMVACWNACEQAGLSPAFLESGGIGRMVEIMRDYFAAFMDGDIIFAEVRERLAERCAMLIDQIPAPADAEKADG